MPDLSALRRKPLLVAAIVTPLVAGLVVGGAFIAGAVNGGPQVENLVGKPPVTDGLTLEPDPAPEPSASFWDTEPEAEELVEDVPVAPDPAPDSSAPKPPASKPAPQPAPKPAPAPAPAPAAPAPPVVQPPPPPAPEPVIDRTRRITHNANYTPGCNGAPMFETWRADTSSGGAFTIGAAKTNYPYDITTFDTPTGWGIVVYVCALD